MIWNQGGNISISNCEIAHSLLRLVSSDYGTTTIQNSILRDGRWGVTGNANVTNCVIADCSTALEGWGGTLTNSIVYFSDCSYTQFNTTYSVFWNSGTVPYGEGNREVNPLFRDAKNGDYRLQAGSPCIDAGDGTVATETDITGAPRYSDPYTTPTGKPDADGEYVDIGAYEFTESASSSIDLTPIDVQAPGQAVTGEKATIQWTIRNNGSAPAIGTWTDEIYLISETGQKIVVGEVTHAGNITAGDLQTFYAEVTVPNVKNGNWTFGVRVNPNREIFEGIATDNNLLQAGTTTTVSVPLLEELLEEAETLSITHKSPALYCVTVAAGESFWLQTSADQSVSVYLSENVVPASELVANYVGSKYGTNASTLYIPEADVNRTFYLVLTTTQPVANVRLKVEDTSLALLGVSLSEASNQGTSTISFYGAGFDSGITVSLTQGTTTISGSDVVVVSCSHATARFDLTGVLPGAYDLTITQNGQTETLKDAVSVVADGVGAVLNAYLTLPDSIRAGRVYSAKITYSNAGDCDMYMPTFVITGGEGNLLGTKSDNVTSTALNVLGVGSSDFAGILRPGEEYTLTFYFMATDSASVSFTPVTSDDDYIGDGTFNTAYWNTWSEFYADLSGAITQLHTRGYATTNYNAAKKFLYAQKAGKNSTGVSGYLRNEATGEAISGCRIYASWNEGENYTSCVSDENGRYVFNYLPQNTTVSLFLEDTAYHLSEPSVSIADHDILDFNLTALPYGFVSGRITDENSQGAAGILVMLSNDTGDYGYAITDRYGQYSINNVPLGTYRISVESAGAYQNIPDQAIEIVNAAGSTMSFSLIEGGGYISQ
ncbi:MAG: carboxypeptidase regulatory-like domain-containing protein, partial [Planctomycetia bacterium]|nr:carboxypeptidase regulatory-like domain-containing protein [Planctomycetia bacterium]